MAKFFLLLDKFFLKCSIIMLLFSALNISYGDKIIGDLRVQVLSSSLVRLELKGPKGFEDRPTFHIVNRKQDDVQVQYISAGAFEIIKTQYFSIKVPSQTHSLESIVITDNQDRTLWSMPPCKESDKLPASLRSNRKWLPEPGEKPQVWVIADTPRIVPAPADSSWGGGYNVAPRGINDNGWDLDNDAPDIYVFLPRGDLKKLRREFACLTGNPEMIPLYAFGGWDSRYYPYKQSEAIQKIETYRSNKIPLDVFVVDTDWRIGASHGYGVNTKLFPDMAEFIRHAHAKNVRIVFNDHPEPQGGALDYTEVKYRNDGLRSKFNMGLDVWWYDRNWHTAIRPPAGINKEVFGMYIYHWIKKDFYPDRRPLIMGNIDGIDHGHINGAPNIGAHRYAIQWTGDTTSDNASLCREIRNAVHTGAYTPFAYVSTDVGGHMGTPTTEQYCRWVQFGAMSAIFRLHCGRGDTRDPWKYQSPAQKVTRDYLQMRMRLLPVFYGAARANYETAMPILNRCDLYYPDYAEAKNDYQYLLFDNILIAPVKDTIVKTVEKDWLNNGKGLEGQYFAGRSCSGFPVVTRTDPTIDFDWADKSAAENLTSDDFSIRWTGEITFKAGSDVMIGVEADDGCRMWINGKLVIDQWVDQPRTTVWAPDIYKNEETCSIIIEYYEAAFDASCRLMYKTVDQRSLFSRQLWIPPGTWIDVWDGKKITGPVKYNKMVSIKQIPLFVKSGAVIPLAPDMQYTNQKAWDPITLDFYAQNKGSSTAELYEDDGISNDYKNNGFRKTLFETQVNDKKREITFVINPAVGTFENAPLKRSWSVRLRAPRVWAHKPTSVIIDGKDSLFRIIPKDRGAMPFAVTGSSPDENIIEIPVCSQKVSDKRIIVVTF